MPPKKLPKVAKGPLDIVQALEEEEKVMLWVFYDNLSVETGDKLQQLFCRLDDNGNNILSARDFRHHNPAADKELKTIWGWFKEHFDWNNDEAITFDEFKQGSTIRIINYLCRFWIQYLII